MLNELPGTEESTQGSHMHIWDPGQSKRAKERSCGLRAVLFPVRSDAERASRKLESHTHTQATSCLPHTHLYGVKCTMMRVKSKCIPRREVRAG